MRAVIAVVLAVFVLMPQAHAGWRGAEWGMTPEQVERSMNGEAPLARSRRDDMAEKVENVGEYVWEGHKFRSLYYYGQEGLSKVVLDWKSGVKEANCQALLEHLITNHGQPLRVGDQVVLKSIIWHDKANENRIRLMVSLPAGICTLYVERLSEFEAHDQANPGLQITPPKRS